MRWHRPRPLAWTSVVALVAVLVLAGCGGKAPSGGGGSSEGGELTLWTHNAGNKEELAIVNQIVPTGQPIPRPVTAVRMGVGAPGFPEPAAAAATPAP